MQRLPPEILINITDNLSPLDLINLSRTCKCILDYLGDDYFRHRFYKDMDPEFVIIRGIDPYRYDSWYDLYVSYNDPNINNVDSISYRLYQLNRKITEEYSLEPNIKLGIHTVINNFNKEINQVIDILINAIEDDDMEIIDTAYYFLPTINDSIFVEIILLTDHLNRIYPILHYDVGVSLIDNYIFQVVNRDITPTLLIQAIKSRYWVRYKVYNYIINRATPIKFVRQVLPYMDDTYEILSNYVLSSNLILETPRLVVKSPIWLLYRILSECTLIFSDKVIRKIIHDNNIKFEDVKKVVSKWTSNDKVRLFLSRLPKYLH
jgi:hypothetical protein